jgi:hypothetical protein
MLPEFYQKCFQNLLAPTQYKMMQILVLVIQFYKTVTLEFQNRCQGHLRTRVSATLTDFQP